MDDATPADIIPIDPDLAPEDPGEPGVDHHRQLFGSHRRHGRARPDLLAAIALGGALGAPARYGVAQLIVDRARGFPWATFATNVSGSFVLGFFLVLVLERFPPTRYLRPFVATGFLGAYTTFSTFAVEADLLVQHGEAWTAATYVVASLFGGLVAAWLGLSSGRLIPHVDHRSDRP